jgi:hypothetical protein
MTSQVSRAGSKLLQTIFQWQRIHSRRETHAADSYNHIATNDRGDLRLEIAQQNTDIVCGKVAYFWREYFYDNELELHHTVG